MATTLGHPPPIKGVSAPLGICGNRQAIEESDQGHTPETRTCQDRCLTQEPGYLDAEKDIRLVGALQIAQQASKYDVIATRSGKQTHSEGQCR